MRRQAFRLTRLLGLRLLWDHCGDHDPLFGRDSPGSPFAFLAPPLSAAFLLPRRPYRNFPCVGRLPILRMQYELFSGRRLFASIGAVPSFRRNQIHAS
jgi:hypothetical protein